MTKRYISIIMKNGSNMEYLLDKNENIDYIIKKYNPELIIIKKQKLNKVVRDQIYMGLKNEIEKEQTVKLSECEL